MPLPPCNASPGEADDLVSAAAPPPPLTVPRAELDARPWAHVTGRFQALDHDFAVRTTDPRLGRYLDAALAPLAVPGRTGTYYSVIEDAATDPGFAIYLGSDRKLIAADADLAARLLLWQVNREAIRRTTGHLLLHASVAEHGGVAVLLPAAMESGKSTLVAGLVQAGLRYLTDETAAIDLASLDVRPFPRSISLDPGSWPLLPGLRPRHAPDLASFSAAQWAVDPRTLRADAIGQPCPPAMVVTPRFRRGAATHLQPLSRAEALQVLVEQTFNLHHLGRSGFEALGAIARRSDCYRLVMGDLGRAVEVLLESIPSLAQP